MNGQRERPPRSSQYDDELRLAQEESMRKLHAWRELDRELSEEIGPDA